MTGSAPWIAVVDGEARMRRASLRLLRLADNQAQASASAAEFLDPLQTCQPDCAAHNLRMPGITEFDVRSRLVPGLAGGSSNHRLGAGSFDTRRCAMRIVPVAYMRKPMNDQPLLGAIKPTLRQRCHQLERQKRKKTTIATT